MILAARHPRGHKFCTNHEPVTSRSLRWTRRIRPSARNVEVDLQKNSKVG